MSVTPQECRVIILVKALPQPSKTHGETVCCAGITATGEWKRLFPIRFRHLSGASSFNRWDWINFRFTLPTHDKRLESCRVHEESIEVDGGLSRRERANFLQPMIAPSINSAIEKNQTLAIIRPTATRFYHKRKSSSAMQAQKDAFLKAARQTSLFDKELAALEPSPFEFRFKFSDGVGHDFENGDWETHAMFYNGKRRGMSEQETLDWMDQTFNVDYPRQGMLFAVGNQMKRPHIWQLLGVLSVENPVQGSLSL